ncbi:MAG: hypothetical protein AAF636_20410, partial [Pseudomonadota bacterium]
ATGDWSTFETRDAGTISLESGTQILRITFEGGSQDIRSFTLTQLETDEPANDGVIGESGTLTVTQSDPDEWFQVEFTEELTDPAVVMGPISSNDSDPANVRVRNVTDTGFEFQIDEWDYLDGTHAAETVSWLAVESGTHSVNGLTVAAGVASVDDAGDDVSFASAFDASPTVLTQVSSTSDGNAVVERVDDVGSGGFSVDLDREEDASGSHPAEALSWIAFEQGGSAGDGLLVGQSDDPVSDATSTISFTDSFAEDEFAFIADMQTKNGADTSLVRLTAINAASATVFVEEETSGDDEVGHVAESIGFAALETGLLFEDVV